MRTEAAGRAVFCEFICVPRLPQSLQALTIDEAATEVGQALALASSRGARLVGLGAYTSVVTQGGARVTGSGVALTTGNTYTVVTAMEAVEVAAQRAGIDLTQAHIVILGAAGMIGSSLVDQFLGRTERLTLIGNPSRPDVTKRRFRNHLEATLAQAENREALVAYFERDPRAAALLRSGHSSELAALMASGEIAVGVECDFDAGPYLGQADIVISATSSIEVLIDVARLKRGAIVLDLSRPSNINQADLHTRPDVLFIDGGVVAFPGAPDFGMELGFPRGHGFACMAETMMLGLDARLENTSIGARIDRSTKGYVRELAGRYGFALSGLRSFNRNLSETAWQTYVTARAERVISTMQTDDRTDRAWVREPSIAAFPTDEPLNLAHWLLERQLSASATHHAAVEADSGNSATYAELWRLTARIAGHLRQQGVIEGQFVGLICHDGIPMLAAILACWRLGAVAAPINPSLAPADLLAVLDVLRPRHLLLGKELDSCRALLALTDAAVCVLEPLLERDPAGGPVETLASVNATTPAVCLFSSGSTGKPKAILHTHGDLLTLNVNYVPTIVRLQPGETVFSPSRMFFAYGLNAVVFALFAGGTAVLPATGGIGPQVLEALQRYAVNVLFAVPAAFKLLLAKLPQQGLSLPSLRLCVSAGEALPGALYMSIQEQLGVEVIDGIGTTEVLSTFISNRPMKSQPGCTGTVVPGFEVRLVNGQGDTCSVGETGTLWVRGDTVAEAFYGDPSLSACFFRDGWFNTNDLFYMDSLQRFFYVGRANDLLKINGSWIAPHQMEEVLAQHPMVSDCAVVPVADEYGLMRPKAFVVARGPIEDMAALWADLKSFSKQRLGAHQYPHLFEFIDQMPRTSNGKLQRWLLREPASLTDETRS
jgi:acyl-coenzyme A synthetase/AMP-(fatty) acid ligase/predicted amino acid dehydrogenase